MKKTLFVIGLALALGACSTPGELEVKHDAERTAKYQSFITKQRLVQAAQDEFIQHEAKLCEVQKKSLMITPQGELKCMVPDKVPQVPAPGK